MMDSSTSFKALYVISKFVAALNQTTKGHKPSFLTTLSLVQFFSFFLSSHSPGFEPDAERQHPGDQSIRAASQSPGRCLIIRVKHSAMRATSSMSTAVRVLLLIAIITFLPFANNDYAIEAQHMTMGIGTWKTITSLQIWIFFN